MNLIFEDKIFSNDDNCRVKLYKIRNKEMINKNRYKNYYRHKKGLNKTYFIFLKILNLKLNNGILIFLII